MSTFLPFDPPISFARKVLCHLCGAAFTCKEELERDEHETHKLREGSIGCQCAVGTERRLEDVSLQCPARFTILRNFHWEEHCFAFGGVTYSGPLSLTILGDHAAHEYFAVCQYFHGWKHWRHNLLQSYVTPAGALVGSAAEEKLASGSVRRILVYREFEPLLIHATHAMVNVQGLEVLGDSARSFSRGIPLG